MADTNFAPLTLEGWFALHQLYRLSRPVLGDSEAGGWPDRARELAALFGGWTEDGDEVDGWSGLYRIVGGETDFMAIHFRPSLEELADAEDAIARSGAGEDLILTGDYVSVVELGLYAETARLLEQAREDDVEPGSEEWTTMARAVLDAQREKGYVQGRLHPTQPEEMPYVCFYPMDKRREPGQNWYSLPLHERAELMHAHGQTGRSYAGRISQIICGSVGLDDWEWGVTLFAGDPLDFKNVVTDMRYDVASAVYADFGAFFVGRRIPVDGIADALTG